MRYFEYPHIVIKSGGKVRKMPPKDSPTLMTIIGAIGKMISIHWITQLGKPSIFATFRRDGAIERS